MPNDYQEDWQSESRARAIGQNGNDGDHYILEKEFEYWLNQQPCAYKTKQNKIMLHRCWMASRINKLLK